MSLARLKNFTKEDLSRMDMFDWSFQMSALMNYASAFRILPVRGDCEDTDDYFMRVQAAVNRAFERKAANESIVAGLDKLIQGEEG